MIHLHPFVEYLENKDDQSLEEAAIVGLMRMSMQKSLSNNHTLLLWLQQLNPHRLRGPELTAWATEVASWILPPSLQTTRSKVILNYTQTGATSESSRL